MAEIEKSVVWEPVWHFTIYEMDAMTVDQFVEKLNELQVAHKAKLRLKQRFNEYDGNESVAVEKPRPETKRETAFRLRKEAELMETHKVYRRAQYEKLKAEFGDK